VRIVSINQSIKGPHKATHGQGEATSQHSHRGQQTLRHEVPQAVGADRLLTEDDDVDAADTYDSDTDAAAYGGDEL